MESYLMMLYVTLEQESALKNFFVKQGWVYCKPDMSVITDKLGPVTSRLSIAFEKVALTDTHSTEEQSLEATNQLQDEQQGSQTKNDIPETTAGVEKINPRHIRKRKTKSLQQPATAAKQAKLVPSTSTDETVGLQGKHNVDNDTENKGEANKPIRIEMENRQQIHIKIEGENLDTIEKEKVGDLIHNAGEESDNAAEDFEAADDDNEDDIGEESAIKIEYAENSSTCEVNLPEAHAAPKVQRKKRRANYDKADMVSAYNYVMETGSPVAAAAKMFGVPITTLKDRVHNRVSIDVAKNGPGTVLSEEEEKKLTAHLKELATLGYGFTQREITCQASYYAIELGKRDHKSRFTRCWYSGYVIRCSEHDYVQSFLLPKQKKLCTNRECISTYYYKLNGIIKEYNLGNNPESIYLMDEVDIDVPDGDECDTVTLIGAGNAAGQKISPYFVLVTRLEERDQDLLRKSHLFTQGFKNYFSNHLSKLAGAGNENAYIIVLYDALRMLLPVELIQWAKSNHLLLFPIPPYLSHIMKTRQSVFQSIKTKYLEKYGEVSPYKHITSTSSVVSMVKSLYDTLVTPVILKKFFSRYGIYPLQESNVMCDFLQKEGIID